MLTLIVIIACLSLYNRLNHFISVIHLKLHVYASCKLNLIEPISWLSHSMLILSLFRELNCYFKSNSFGDSLSNLKRLWVGSIITWLGLFVHFYSILHWSFIYHYKTFGSSSISHFNDPNRHLDLSTLKCLEEL